MATMFVAGEDDNANNVSGTSEQSVPLQMVLDEAEAFLARYVVLARPEALTAVVLWVAHTHAIAHADATPYLAVYSPEKQSGKTRLLECLAILASESRGPLVMPTASTIFRTLDAQPEATLLIDELDAVFRDRSDKYEEVRAVINAGHRRGATVPRSVAGPRNSWVVRDFPVFGAKALAGIGKLPDTVADRSIPIRMLKRKASEHVARFHHRTALQEGQPIASRLRASVSACPPAETADVPLGLTDRAADAWEPLIALADLAGGRWPVAARTAAVVLHAARPVDESLGLRLLSDIRLLFAARSNDRISTADLIAGLIKDDEGPWIDSRWPLTPHRLAKLLGVFEIHSRQMRIGDTNVKGYERDDFVDPWERYLLADLPTPQDTKLRNNKQAAGFDVADSQRAGGEGVGVDLPVTRDYPVSGWVAGEDDGLPPDELWVHTPLDPVSEGRT